MIIKKLSIDKPVVWKCYHCPILGQAYRLIMKKNSSSDACSRSPLQKYSRLIIVVVRNSVREIEIKNTHRIVVNCKPMRKDGQANFTDQSNDFPPPS
jgi:hypothetical protein